MIFRAIRFSCFPKPDNPIQWVLFVVSFSDCWNLYTYLYFIARLQLQLFARFLGER